MSESKEATDKCKEVLSVDDDSEMQDLLTLVLETEGYTVSLAQDGMDAIDMIKAARPDIVLLDLMMPRMDGFGFLYELGRLGLRDSLPVIILSAYAEQNLVRVLNPSIRAKAILGKPIKVTELLARIHQALAPAA